MRIYRGAPQGDLINYFSLGLKLLLVVVRNMQVRQKKYKHEIGFRFFYFGCKMQNQLNSC